MPQAHLTIKSSNRKTGKIPVSTTSHETCPPTCPLRDHGCYGNGGPLAIHWRRVTEGTTGTDWKTFCRQVASLPEGTLWRHNQAGDLPGTDGIIDRRALGELVFANTGKRGFTFTHYCPSMASNAVSIEDACEAGFTVNVSTEGVARADWVAAHTYAPIATIIPTGTPHTTRTPRGRKIIACPAQYRDSVTCATCGLCAIPDRQVIIGFYPHGSQKKSAKEVAS